MKVAITEFQRAYRTRWRESNLCEEIAAKFLMLNLGLGAEDVLPTGKGALSDELLDDPLESPPDFYVPKLDLWFEVTSSNLTRAQSLCRCLKHGLDKPHIFVREGKLESLKLNRALSRTYFVSVNWADGSVLFLPAVLVKKYDLVDWYEYGGRERYYAVPWKDWWAPSGLRRIVQK
ncbi:MAG: nuclease [Candidatus Methanomethylicaceae archaeon]